MAFDIDFAIEHVRAILLLKGQQSKSPEKASEALWHKKMLATHINMCMGKIGEQLTGDQESIVDGFIQHIARSYPGRVFPQFSPGINGKLPTGQFALDPTKISFEAMLAISSPKSLRNWLASLEVVRSFCAASAKTPHGRKWLNDAASEWKAHDLQPPFYLEGMND